MKDRFTVLRRTVGSGREEATGSLRAFMICSLHKIIL
jgi:hypothetical protein